MAEKKSAKSTQKKYPNTKFNNKAIEKSEKNAVNVNVALDRKQGTNATDDYLAEVRKQKDLIDDIVIVCTILVAGLLYLSLFNLCGLIGTEFSDETIRFADRNALEQEIALPTAFKKWPLWEFE